MGTKFDCVKAIVSDNASAMKNLRALVTKEYPHVMDIGCFLHSINLICKNTINNPTNNIKKWARMASRLVSFTTGSTNLKR